MVGGRLGGAGRWIAIRGGSHGRGGFTLLELVIAVAVIGIISAMAIPAFSSIYGECCVKAVAWEIVDMIKEAKQHALVDDTYYALGFRTDSGTISLISDRGPDGGWNTGDDRVVRSLRLSDKGGGLRFGYGSYGPVPPDYAPVPDGVSFQSNNTLVCNPELTGNAGTVYISTASGAAVAITVNSRDFKCTLRRWDGTRWVKM